MTAGLTPGTPVRAPTNLFAALDALVDGKVLPGYFPGRLVDLFAALKRSETSDLLHDPSPQEYSFYL
jgi:glutamine synthetase